MNRRTALMLSMFLGGLVPGTLWAQQSRSKRASSSRDRTLEPASKVGDDPDSIAVGDDPPAPFASEPGFQWKTYDIAKYCQIHTQNVPIPIKFHYQFCITLTRPKKHIVISHVEPTSAVGPGRPSGAMLPFRPWCRSRSANSRVNSAAVEAAGPVLS